MAKIFDFIIAKNALKKFKFIKTFCRLLETRVIYFVTDKKTFKLVQRG